MRVFLRYAMSGGAAEVAVMLLGPLFGMALPLLPSQILWINMLTHGLPGVALGAEPADPRTTRRGPRPVDEHLLGDGLAGRIAWTGALVAAVALAVGAFGHATDRPWQSMVFLALGLSQLGVALALRAPGRSPRFLDLAVAAAVVLQVSPCVLPPLRELLDLEWPGTTGFGLALAAAAVPGLVVAATESRRRARYQPPQYGS